MESLLYCLLTILPERVRITFAVSSASLHRLPGVWLVVLFVLS